MRIAPTVVRRASLRWPAAGHWLVVSVAILTSAVLHASADEPLDLTKAEVVWESNAGPVERRAVAMLIEEVEKRTGTRWPIVTAEKRTANRPGVVVGTAEKPAPMADGFTIECVTEARQPARIVISGHDPRGVLFGIGKLLRTLEMSRGRVLLPSQLSLSSSPAYPLRGHQLGYRPKTNSYDGWSPAMWEQYIRDLAVFGANAIELLPPKTDDDDQSPHFPIPKQEMMTRMSQLAADYGLDVWVWYPAIDGDYSQPEVVSTALDEWCQVLGKLPKLDTVFVPTGDPGATPPALLLPVLEQFTKRLKGIHPHCQTWISVQGLTQQGFDELLATLQTEPEWLGGIVFGPQTRVSLQQLREMLPKRYPIRRYPDITHSLRCEFPVPDWDLAYGQTLGREPINPRPLDQAAIFRDGAESAVGFITYSEGCNDDVNKAVWSALGWDPQADVREILRDYSRYFLGPQYAESFSEGLLALESNWRGPLISNQAVSKTLTHFRRLEQAAGPETLANWRFQQAQYRAGYDSYIQRRLVSEQRLEREARTLLSTAATLGSTKALDRAETILARATTEPAAPELKAHVFDLAESLFQSIRMQLSVSKYQAIEVDRGANLDTIDLPLNDREWLEAQFAGIRELPDEDERLAAIDALLRFDDPGPGGFYDDLGNPGRQPHLVAGEPYARDPGFRRSPLTALDYEPSRRLAWCTRTDGFFDTPVKLRYAELDRDAAYRVRVVYGDDYRKVQVRLTTDDGAEVHSWIDKPDPMKPLEFDVPREATRDGSLTLIWEAQPSRGGPGRGCQLAEVWLLCEQK